MDGLKRKNDLAQFQVFLKEVRTILPNISLARTPPILDDCRLIKEWSECNGPVFFDFGAELPLWCLLPRSSKGAHYLGPFPRRAFIELHNGQLNQNGQSFSDLMKTLNELIFLYENPPQQSIPIRVRLPLSPSMQRSAQFPLNPGQRYLQRLMRSPKRRGRF